MGKCKQTGCNIDTRFIDKTSKSKYCYFHEVTQDYLVLKNRLIELSEEGVKTNHSLSKKELIELIKIKQNRLYDPRLIANFYWNFSILMTTKLEKEISFNEFCFPLGNKDILYLHLSPDDGSNNIWQNKLNFCFGDKLHFYNAIELNKFLLQHSSISNLNTLLSQEFNPSIHISGITFNSDIFIQTHNKVTMQSSVFAGNSFILTANALSMINCKFSNSDKQACNIAVPFNNLKLSNKHETLFEKANIEVILNDGSMFTRGNYKSYKEDFVLWENAVPKLKIPKEFLTDSSVNTSNKGLLNNVDIRNILFLDGDRQDNNDEYLSKLNFVNCKFINGHKLLESKTHPNSKQLEYSYRYLRKHYDEKGDYIEGNDFHYNYMEAKKKSSSLWDKLWLYPYGWINGYNTKPGRTIIALLILIILATIINTCYGNFIIKNIYDTAVNGHDFFSSILFSAANVVPIINKDTFIPMGTISLKVTMMENLFGPILITLLIMALRNRFRRSKTPEEIKEN